MKKHLSKAVSWTRDYAHLARGTTRMYIHRNPPSHYLGHIVEGKSPVIIVPGITHKWSFLKPIADTISLQGHPIYIVPNLGHNMHDIPKSAQIVTEVISENKLEHVIIVGHSKGGLIGKYLLIHNPNQFEKMVSIASPFSGSALARLLPHRSYKDLRQDSKILHELEEHPEVNKKIVLIVPEFDNHVLSIPHLDGAKNIVVPVHGHHKILFDKTVQEMILKELS